LGAGFDLDRFEVLTFDCYGTLIDWEAGLLAEIRPILGSSGAALTDDQLLERYAVHESAVEAAAYQSYRDVLAASLRALADELEVALDADAEAGFATSVPRWPAFPDSADALSRLADRFRLGVITNCDDDLFAASASTLGARFDWVVTAQQVRAYKPSLLPFERALATIDVPRDRILHVAQSLYHDHVPAQALGMATMWVNRRHDRPGFGATPPATVTPDYEVRDLAGVVAAADA
jgi:2-haloacid dehalogenase